MLVIKFRVVAVLSAGRPLAATGGLRIGAMTAQLSDLPHILVPVTMAPQWPRPGTS